MNTPNLSFALIAIDIRWKLPKWDYKDNWNSYKIPRLLPENNKVHIIVVSEVELTSETPYWWTLHYEQFTQQTQR